MPRKIHISFAVAFIISMIGTFAASAQQRRSRPTIKKPVPVLTASPTPTPEKANTDIRSEPPKKNERPSSIDKKANGSQTPYVQDLDFTYRYEFTRPEFVVDHVIIEHDTAGKGHIMFTKRDSDEMITEPIELSPKTLESLNAALDALDFVNSTEDYQYVRDYSHLGNVTITFKKNGKQRTAKYNWTENKDAKSLMDEYRRISNQFIWMFDIDLARQNQPLETPKLLDSFESMIKRNEIADPEQMVPFLAALGNDERVPLIGRNHAGKIIKQIEKQKK